MPDSPVSAVEFLGVDSVSFAQPCGSGPRGTGRTHIQRNLSLMSGQAEIAFPRDRGISLLAKTLWPVIASVAKQSSPRK